MSQKPADTFINMCLLKSCKNQKKIQNPYVLPIWNPKCQMTVTSITQPIIIIIHKYFFNRVELIIDTYLNTRYRCYMINVSQQHVQNVKHYETAACTKINLQNELFTDYERQHKNRTGGQSK